METIDYEIKTIIRTMSDQMKELLANLRYRASSKWKLWDANYLDRLKIDYWLRKKVKVTASDTPIRWSWWWNSIICEKKYLMPVKFIPNCVKYLGEINMLSWISALFGITRRDSRLGGWMIGWLNGHRNGFLRYYMGYMGSLRDCKKSREYWWKAEYLMGKRVYQVACFNYVCAGWERRWKDKQIDFVLTELQTLIASKPLDIDYRRVYIEKANGKLRPLGVPSPAWRIYLHMWNSMLSWWITTRGEESQHGFQLGKGTHTAWKELMGRLKESNIYEFDLEDFFGQVKLDYNEKRMKETGVPDEIAEYLTKLNRSIVKLEDIDMLDEEEHRKVIWNPSGAPNPNHDKSVKEDLEEGGERAKIRVAALKEEGYSEYRTQGVPQGASTSCSLSILNLKGMFEELKGLIMYADDGLYFPQEEGRRKIQYEEAGIKESEEKSGWIKKSGVWRTSLKFLGLEYVPSGIERKEDGDTREEARLRAFTRGGSRLEYDEKYQLWTYLEEKYERDRKLFGMEKLKPTGEKVGEWIERQISEFNELGSEEKIAQLFNSKVGLTAISRLYGGSWKEDNPSGIRFGFSRGSWCHIHWGEYIKHLAESGRLELMGIRIVENPHTPKKEREEVERGLRLLGINPENLWLSEEGVGNPVGSWRFEKRLGLRGLFSHGERWELEEDETIKELTREEKKRTEEAREGWRILLNSFELTEYNSSSLACDSLLNRMKMGGSLMNWGEKRKVRYYKGGENRLLTPYQVEELRLWARSAEAMKNKRIKRERRYDREMVLQGRIKLDRYGVPIDPKNPGALPPDFESEVDV